MESDNPALFDIGADRRLRLHPHKGQQRLWRSDKRFVFGFAGTQAGKTAFGPWWLLREIERMGPGDYLAVTSSYDLFKLKMLPAMREVFETLMDRGRYWPGDKVIEIKDPETKQFRARRSSDPMWARIILRSAAAKSGLESATAKAAWLDEVGQDEFTLEAWEAVLRRLSLSQGRVLGTTTLYNVGWLKTEVYDRWLEGDPDYEVIQFPSIQNPAFPQAEFERARETMAAWKFAMFYLGEYSRPAGLVYPDWADTWLEDPFAIPSDWRRVCGIDFGGANLAQVWLAQDPETEFWHLYRETLRGNMPAADHVSVTRGEIDGPDIVFVGGSPSETQPRMDWTAAGLEVEEPRIGALEPGIDRVTALMKPGRLRVFKSCKGVRDELGSYRRKLDSAGDPTEVIVDKRTFHRLDALRAAAIRITEGPKAMRGGFDF